MIILAVNNFDGRLSCSKFLLPNRSINEKKEVPDNTCCSFLLSNYVTFRIKISIVA